MTNRCTGCGLPLAGGDDECQKLFEQLIARDFSDYRYGRFHRLAVDAYTVQHPDRYCRSAKSLLAHLGGLCCAFEHDGDPGTYRSLQRSLNCFAELAKPNLPADRGAVTLVGALEATDPEIYAREVRRWALSVWETHKSVHGFARDWLWEVLT